MEAPKEHVSEEPLPGWLKVEVEGQKPFYKTPFPRKIIRSAAMLQEYLAKEHLAGRNVSVDTTKFSFKRKYGLRAKVASASSEVENLEELAVTEDVVVEVNECREARSVVDLLTRNPDKSTDHRRLLSNKSKQIDEFQDKYAYQNPSNFQELADKFQNILFGLL